MSNIEDGETPSNPLPFQPALDFGEGKTEGNGLCPWEGKEFACTCGGVKVWEHGNCTAGI